jgi:uncharacterized protein (TIGR02246 family)
MPHIAAKSHLPLYAEAEAEIRRCLDQWIEAINRGSINLVGALYEPDAVLLGTFAPQPLTTPEGRQEYFIRFKARTNMEATIDQCSIEAFGDDVGAASGLYTFSFEGETGAQETVKARFTFVYRRFAQGSWLIVMHHSSVVPAP